MEGKALARLEALRQRNADRAWVNHDLYQLLYKPDLYEAAYQKIKSKPGNMTPGSDGETLDGYSFRTVETVIQSLRDESFQFKPARRVWIPKSNGKMRPLSIASPRDKIVQEVIRMILEAIYDSPQGAYFHNSSHGFRPHRSCHTALREFRYQWPGIVWMIEGDIQSCFDEIDHQVLVSLLRKKIADDRFLNLIWKTLRAGYLWKNEPRDTLMGSPQGSICSPILANIYLHELDEFVETLKKRYEKGEHRKLNLEYHRIAIRRRRLLKRTNGVWTSEVKSLTKQMRALPSMLMNDPDYVRIKYLRYADDWLLGLIGPKELAVTIRMEIQTFLQEELRLQLNLEKTHIRHAKTEEAFFLGTRLKIGQSPGTGTNAKIAVTHSTDRRPFKRRSTGWWPMMRAPIKSLIDKLHSKGFCMKDGFPISKGSWAFLDVDQIVKRYNTVGQLFRELHLIN